MPTYEYKCEACGGLFEKFQSITAAPIRQCPHCKKSKARRLISAGAGIIFKGSGFYTTDYRSESYKSAAKSDTAAPAASDTKTTSSGNASSPAKASSDSAASSGAANTSGSATKSDSTSGGGRSTSKSAKD